MKLFYITNARIPTEKAHGLQIMQMCEAFAEQGFDVELVLPRRKNPIKEDAFSYYGIDKKFAIKYLSSPDWELSKPLLNRIIFLTQSILFAFFAKRFVKSQVKENDSIIYSRDLFTLYLLRNTVPQDKIIFEAHNFPKKILPWHKKLFSKLEKVVVISRALEEDFKKNFPHLKILLARDGFDKNLFTKIYSKTEARKILGIQEGIKMVLYTGQLFWWKGVETLIKSKLFWQNSALLYIVGGLPEDTNKLEGFAKMLELKDVIFTGQKLPKEIPLYLAAADLVVVPNSGKAEISQRYTSPLKVFEAMAAGKPIIASNLPSLREILNEKTALFFEADNADDLAKKIDFLLEHSDSAKTLGKNAKEISQNYDWNSRANLIKKFL
jgi:glycosyltransferase involved in cell wall biosynthesis